MTTAYEQEFIGKCNIAFAAINRKCLGELAYFLRWSMEDMRQEFLLTCWEALSGSGGFDKSKGTLQGYFVGKIKTLLYRRDGFHNFDSMDGNPHEDATSAETSYATQQSTLDLLIEREEAQQDRRRHRNESLLCSLAVPSVKAGWVERLRQQGLTQTQIAEIGGVSQAYVSRVLKKSRTGNTTL
jgi:DNA-binding transcriptional regulator YiaG